MWRAGEEGQALVETAVSISLLFVLLLLGSVEFGRLVFAAIEVSNAAKAAAQYGAQNNATALDQTGMLQAAQSEFLTPSAISLLSPSGTNGYSCVCASNTAVSVSCTNNSLTSPTCPGSFVEVNIQVQVSTSFDPLFHVPGLPRSYSLVGTAQQKVLQ